MSLKYRHITKKSISKCYEEDYRKPYNYCLFKKHDLFDKDCNTCKVHWHVYFKNKYGVGTKIRSSNDGSSSVYEIIDEKKFLLFILIYGT
jgi:hypothetical protein